MAWQLSSHCAIVGLRAFCHNGSSPRMQAFNALITGASRGLGTAIAREFWNKGANVALVARDSGRLQEIADELRRSAGNDVQIIAADLSDPEAPAMILERLRTVWDHLDVLVNNAAITGPIGPLTDNDWNEWQAAIRINLLAPVALCRLAIPWMKPGSAIVNVSGGGAAGPRPNFSAYGTAKAALVRFTETLAQETAELGIRVNAIAPGAMNTEMLEAVLRSGILAGKELARAQEQKQQGGVPPERAAALVYYLAARVSEGITGRLVSAVWDPWNSLAERAGELRESDIYTLRRITPEDRGKKWT
jgi:NAD(P)-dependent dehydrogenase (short-subunit alcohol dehydrogenase family)